MSFQKPKDLSILLSSGAVLTSTFLIVIALLNVGENAIQFLTQWGENIQIAAYLTDEVTEDEIPRLKAEIAKITQSEDILFTDKKAAASLFKKQMASLAPDLLEDAEFATPFPASLTARLPVDSNAKESASDLKSLADRISALEGVSEVSYGQSWIQSYSSVFTVVRILAVVLSLVLLLSATLIVSHATRSLVYQRESEIELLELIGATDKTIRRPFYIRALTLVSTSLIVALVGNWVLYLWVQNKMSQSVALARLASELKFLGPTSFLMVIGLVLSTALIGTWFSLSGLNTGWAAARNNKLRRQPA